jgi:hypothetical protein
VRQERGEIKGRVELTHHPSGDDPPMNFEGRSTKMQRKMALVPGGFSLWITPPVVVRNCGEQAITRFEELAERVIECN